MSDDLFSDREDAFTFSDEDFGRRYSTERKTRSGSEKPISSNPTNLNRGRMQSGGGNPFLRALRRRLAARR
jgi:hypothetical protein